MRRSPPKRRARPARLCLSAVRLCRGPGARGRRSRATHSLDQDKIAEYIHTHTIPTVVGNIAFGPDGEWTKSHFVVIQFQNLVRNNLDDFRDTTHTVVLWPEALKTGKMIFPYADAKK